MKLGRHHAALAVAAMVVLLSLSGALLLYHGQDHGVEVVDHAGEVYAFEVYKEGSATKARNLDTGEIEFSSSDSLDVIQRSVNALREGGIVHVKEGTYVLNGVVNMLSDTGLRGEGPMTVFEGRDGVSFMVEGKRNVSMGDFSLRGSGSIQIAAHIAPVSDVTVEDVTATVDSRPEGVFYVVSMGAKVSNISFLRCAAVDCGTTGFLNSGRLDVGMVEKISYQQCKAIGCGVGSRYNDWVVGFDFAERVNVRDVQVIDCEATRNWQSGFHFEEFASATQAVLRGCVATDNGQAKGAPNGEGYGYGYLLFEDRPKHDITLIGCSAGGNWNGDTSLGPLSSVQG